MINKLKPKSEFSRNVLTLMTGTMIAQAIPILISPILTRIYTPEDFGILALFIGLVSIAAVVVSGRYDLSIILPKLDTHAVHLLLLSITIALIVSSLYLLIIIFVHIIKSFHWIYFLIPITVFFIGLNNIFDKYNNRIKNYKLMSYQRLIKTSVEAIISITFLLFFGIKLGMIWGFIFGYFMSSMTMLYVNYQTYKYHKIKPSFIKMKSLAQRYSNFPQYNMPNALLNTIAANLPIFFIPLFYSEAILGLYAFGFKIVQAPLVLLSVSIFNVLGQTMASRYSMGEEIESLFIQMAKKLISIAIIIVPFFFFLDDIFAFVFGEDWRVSGEYIQILSPWILLVFIVSPFATIPHIYNKQKKALYIEVISFILKILLFFIGGMFLTIEEILFGLMLISSMVILYSFVWYYQLVKISPKKREEGLAI